MSLEFTTPTSMFEQSKEEHSHKHLNCESSTPLYLDVIAPANLNHMRNNGEAEIIRGQNDTLPNESQPCRDGLRNVTRDMDHGEYLFETIPSTICGDYAENVSTPANVWKELSFEDLFKDLMIEDMETPSSNTIFNSTEDMYIEFFLHVESPIDHNQSMDKTK